MFVTLTAGFALSGTVGVRELEGKRHCEHHSTGSFIVFIS